MTQTKHNKKSMKSRGVAFYSLTFALPVIQFCIFYIGVNFNSILLTFKEYDTVKGEYSFAAFENFSKIFDSLSSGNELAYAVKNSLLLWASNTLIGVTLALLFSYYIYRKKPCSGFLRVLLFLPQILSSIVMSFIFMFLVGRGLTSIGFPDYLNELETQFPTLIFYNVWVGFGSSVLLYSGAMGQVSTEMLEAAEVDGASDFVAFIRLVLPSIFPTITTFLVTGVAGIFTNQAALFNFFAQGAKIESYTIGYYLFQKVAATNAGFSQYPLAAAGGLVFTFVAAPLTLLVRYLLEKFGPSED